MNSIAVIALFAVVATPVYGAGSRDLKAFNSNNPFTQEAFNQVADSGSGFSNAGNLAEFGAVSSLDDTSFS